MVAAFLGWEFCALPPRYEITKDRLPALKFSGLVIIIHPTGNLSLSSLRYTELMNLSFELCAIGSNHLRIGGGAEWP
jgi:hypothetical protein